MKVLLVLALLVGSVAAYVETADARPGECGPHVDRCDPPEFVCEGWPPSDPVARAQWLADCVLAGMAWPGVPVSP